MKLEHSFTVPVGIDDAWKILLDIERIGPCMPGAAIDSVDGDDFTGTVKVKLGPIGLTYKGKASFIEKDEAAHRAVIDARGRDARGNGTASAKVTATLTEDNSTTTTVLVNTDLDITGKPAQFGRGVMVDVGNKLIGQFADQLANTIANGDGAGVAAAAPAASTVAASAEAGSAEAAPDQKQASRPKPASTPTEDAADAGQGAAAAAALDSLNALPTIEESALDAAAAGPGGYSAPTAVNGRAAIPAAMPQREVEPINLLEHAGPAVAKRLAPVIAAVMLVIAVVRYRRSHR